MELEKKRKRRRARAGIRVQNGRKKALYLLALRENRDQQQLIESMKNEVQRIDDQDKNVSSLNNSIKNNLQCETNCQPSADSKQSSSKQLNLPQKNEEAEKLDHPNETVSSLHDSIEDNLQSEENCQPSADFMKSSSLEQQKLPQNSEETVEISQAQENSSSSCQNIEKVTKIEEEESSPDTNIKILLLKQEKLCIQYKNRIEKCQLQDKIVSYFHKYIKLCSDHEDEVFKVKQKLIEYELQIAREKKRLKTK